MAELSVFIPDTKQSARWEPIGNGRCLYLGYREKPGLFQKRKEKKHLLRAKGTSTLQPEFSEKLSLPLLSGNGEILVHSLCDRLVPKAAEDGGLVLSVGKSYDTAAILKIAKKVRTLEIIMAEDDGHLAECIGEETGLVVPVHNAFHPANKIFMRLPGGMACGGGAIDLSSPQKTCLFAPPEELRPICRIVGSDGDTLEALLRFFGIPYDRADIFLSKITKLCRK
ncbi:MAG: hypothetical protein IJN74_05100 [Clostridia bacterium]|nr:hypothetical protein [Clostridia bacterium]